MVRDDSDKLGEILISQGIVTSQQMAEAAEEQKLGGRFIGEILVSRGVASEEQISRALSEQLGFAFVDLSMMSVEPKAVELVPRELCVKFTAIPLYVVQETLTLAMFNPLNVGAIDEIQAVSNYRVKPVFALSTDIHKAIDKNYGDPRDTAVISSASPAATLPPLKGKDDISSSSDPVAKLKEAANLAPVVEKLNTLIDKAVKAGASDIHLEPERNSFHCRCRVDGVLYPFPDISAEEQAAVISRIKIMANIDIAEKRLPQDGRVRISAGGREVDLRISTFPTVHGENVVIRILDRSAGVLELGQLGFSKKTLKLFTPLINQPYGMVLVTGPTGSGKTTTLYAALNEINNVEKNIITLEDPVEYEIPRIRQSQVNVKANLTFASGLRSIVRQDPDVIMIGEIRDRETADISIHAALTGHMVFSTLHTNDAASAATRLIDMGVEPFLVASSLSGVLAQRLMRTLCSDCKKEYDPSEELLKQLGLPLKNDGVQPKGKKGKYVFYKEQGCEKCNERGYLGRTGIYELLISNEEIKELITQKTSSLKLREAAIRAGMFTLRKSGLEKVLDGVTSVSELLRITEDAG